MSSSLRGHFKKITVTKGNWNKDAGKLINIFAVESRRKCLFGGVMLHTLPRVLVLFPSCAVTLCSVPQRELPIYSMRGKRRKIRDVCLYSRGERGGALDGSKSVAPQVQSKGGMEKKVVLGVLIRIFSLVLTSVRNAKTVQGLMCVSFMFYRCESPQISKRCKNKECEGTQRGHPRHALKAAGYEGHTKFDALKTTHLHLHGRNDKGVLPLSRRTSVEDKREKMRREK